MLLDELERTLLQTVSIAADVFGEGHPFHRRALEQIAEYLHRRGRHEEANEALRMREGRRARPPGILPNDSGAATPPVGGSTRPLAARPALMDVRQAARYLTISRETLYKLIRSGEIPHIRVGKSIRLRSAEIDWYLAKRDTQSWTRVDARGRPASSATPRRRDDSPE